MEKRAMSKRGFGKKDFVNALVVGFALFATFFGAGNLIFPPVLGLNAGKSWLASFFPYLISDAGIAIVGVLAVVKIGGSMEDQLSQLGKWPSRILCVILMMLIGPLVTIPRTGATTYEMSAQPLFPGLSSWVFSAFFFAVVALLTIKPAAVVDIIGKYLTPVLLLALAVLCVKGIVAPLGTPVESRIPGEEVRNGLIYGYQTLDALVAVPLAMIIIKSVKDKGYREKREIAGMVSVSSAVAFVGLLAVYAGLSYLGATVSGEALTELSGTELVVEITGRLLQRAGIVILGVIVLMACLTTAIGTTSAVTEYLCTLMKNKLSYGKMVVAMCVLSYLLCNLGTSQIIALAEPMLTLIYPVFLTQIFLVFFSKRIKTPWVFRCSAIGAALFMAADLLYSKFGILDLPFLKAVPLESLGLGWVLPAVVGGIIGAFIRPKAEPAEKTDAAA